jgi:phosphopantetheinyl transferase (holo-ACP synthase)
VVDLGRPETRNKSNDQRFLDRVFNASEVAWIRSAADPDRMLWMMWAAKEAAFKVLRKQNSCALFEHRSYSVLPPPEMSHAADTIPAVKGRGTVSVRHEGEAGVSALPVEWEVTQRLVHCLARSASADRGSVRAAVCEVDRAAEPRSSDRWTERELLSAHTAESREVRLLAKRLATEAGLGAVEIVRNPGARRLGPPLLYATGEDAPLKGWDLTLSHDGDFAAAALCAVLPSSKSR